MLNILFINGDEMEELVLMLKDISLKIYDIDDIKFQMLYSSSALLIYVTSYLIYLVSYMFLF